MGLIVTELNELRKLLADYKDGRISKDDLSCQILIYNQTDKRIRNSLKYASLLLKTGMKRDAKKMLEGNLLGDADKVDDQLPIYNRTITRGQDE